MNDFAYILPTLDMKTIESAQVNDENISRLIVAKQTDTPLELETELNITPFLPTLIQLYEQLELHNGVLVLRERDVGTQCRIVLPTELIDTVLTATHAADPATHEGVSRVLGRLLPFYYWPFMKRDVKLYVNSCPTCDPFKRFVHKKSPLGHIPASDRGDLVAIDVFGGKEALKITKLGNKYVFVIIDVFTKYCQAVPTSNQTAETLVDKFTSDWLLRFGAPHRLLSDQGTAFESAQFQNMCIMRGTI